MRIQITTRQLQFPYPEIQFVLLVCAVRTTNRDYWQLCGCNDINLMPFCSKVAWWDAWLVLLPDPGIIACIKIRNTCLIVYIMIELLLQITIVSCSKLQSMRINAEHC